MHGHVDTQQKHFAKGKKPNTVQAHFCKISEETIAVTTGGSQSCSCLEHGERRLMAKGRRELLGRGACSRSIRKCGLQ